MIESASLDERDGLRYVVEEITGCLLPGVAARIGIDQEDLKARLTVNLTDSNQIDAWVHVLDGGMNICITIDRALLLFYHKMLKVFVSTIGIGKSQELATERPKIPYKWIVATCKGLVQAYWDSELFSRGGLMMEELGQGQLAILARLLWSCECYAVAHELGHVVMDLSTSNPVELALAKRHVESFLRNFPEMDEQAKLELVEPWTEELCADLIGLNLTLSQPNTNRLRSWANYKQWLCGGAEINHLLRFMLNEYYDRLHYGSQIRLVSSHPHDYLRWKTLSISPDRGMTKSCG